MNGNWQRSHFSFHHKIRKAGKIKEYRKLEIKFAMLKIRGNLEAGSTNH